MAAINEDAKWQSLCTDFVLAILNSNKVEAVTQLMQNDIYLNWWTETVISIQNKTLAVKKLNRLLSLKHLGCIQFSIEDAKIGFRKDILQPKPDESEYSVSNISNSTCSGSNITTKKRKLTKQDQIDEDEIEWTCNYSLLCEYITKHGPVDISSTGSVDLPDYLRTWIETQKELLLSSAPGNYKVAIESLVHRGQLRYGHLSSSVSDTMSTRSSGVGIIDKSSMNERTLPFPLQHKSSSVTVDSFTTDHSQSANSVVTGSLSFSTTHKHVTFADGFSATTTQPSDNTVTSNTKNHAESAAAASIHNAICINSIIAYEDRPSRNVKNLALGIMKGVANIGTFSVEQLTPTDSTNPYIANYAVSDDSRLRCVIASRVVLSDLSLDTGFHYGRLTPQSQRAVREVIIKKALKF